MKYLSLIILVSMLAVPVGCAFSSSSRASHPTSSSPPQSTAQEAPQLSPSDSFKRVVRKGGWMIPALSHSKVVMPRKLFKQGSSESVKMYRTSRKPEGSQEEAYMVETNYFTDEDRHVLSLLPSKYQIMEIIEYDIDERIFCYVLRVHPEGIGAVDEWHYYDGDGDGKFEELERHRLDYSFIPQIPQWLLQK